MSSIEQVESYVSMIRPYVVEEIVDFKKVYDPNDFEMNKQIGLDIYKSFEDMDKGLFPTADLIAKVAVASMQNVQIRDLFMGIHLEVGIPKVGAWLEIAGSAVVKDDAVAIATLVGYYYFISGEKESAIELVNDIHENYPDYSLASLLHRSFPIAPVSMFTDMSNKLHTKVKAEVFGAGA